MLRITPSTSAGGSKNYFDESLSRGDYYSEGQEIAGSWGGRAAQSFGLKGEVSRKAFHQLCDNINPHTGERLTARNREGRRVGYDFNFHCPKKLSAVYALTEDPRILEAFRTSVQETMVELEKDTECRVRDNGKSGSRKTGNMVWGEFVHFTTRPVDGTPDPHLHAHCFAFNATWDGERDMWKAADFGNIKRDARYFEAAFHSRLSGRMAQIGYAVERDGKGFWDIAGIPDSVREKYSRRTAEIEEMAAELGIVNPKALDELGAKSRQAKSKGKSTKDLQNEWNSWLTPAERAAIHAAADDADETPRVPQLETADAIEYGQDHLFERNSTVAESELAEQALRRGFGAVGVSDVWRRIDGLIATKALKTGTKDGRAMVASREMLREESEMVAFAKSTRGSCAPLAPADYEFSDPLYSDPAKAADTAEQKRAIRRALGSHDRVIDIDGGAGVGKTTMMREVVKAVQEEVIRGIEASGHKVFAFAPTADASRGVMRKEGFKDANTVEQLFRRETQEKIRGQVIWIDESGLLGAKKTNAIFKIAEAHGCRVILSGDEGQHHSVEAGDALRTLRKYHATDPIRITRIQRQRVHDGDEPENITAYRRAVQHLAEGDGKAGFDQLEKMGVIVEADPDTDYRQWYDRIGQDYLDAIEGKNLKGKANKVLAVSPTHAESALVTGSIRSALKQAGKIDATDHEKTRLINLNWTEAERTDPARYNSGLVVQFHQNVSGGINRGERFTVTGADENGVQVSASDGTVRTLPLDAADRFSVYAEKTLELARGDRIRITQNGFTADRQHRLNNGALYDVDGFTKDGDIRLSNGWVVGRDYGHIAHGFVTTSHASQGKTVDVVLIAQSAQSLPASNLEQFYVSVSRGREHVRIYTDDKADLRKAISRSSHRMSALELAETKGRTVSSRSPDQQETQREIRLKRQERQAKHRRRKFNTVRDRREMTRKVRDHGPRMDRK